VESWDYIIVGAGSAGSVLAHRLTAHADVSVLLVEAGGSDRSPYVQIPAGIVKVVGNPRFDWCLTAEPDPTRFDKVDLWPAGKTLGGSSSINGMLYVRGAPQDFDGWAQLGNVGWSYADVLPYFMRLEGTALGDAQLRGRHGPQHVAPLRTTHPLADTFKRAALECGLANNPDYNGVTNEGVAAPQVTQAHGRRMSAARAFLWPAMRRRNLHVMTRAVVEELVFDGTRCSGVRILRGTDRIVRTARAEVIVAAGALASPKLLLLSGIGPAAQLSAHGIPVRIARDAVGANLCEHANSLVCADVNTRTYNAELHSIRAGWHLANWLLFGRGPATSPYPHAVAFMRSSPQEPRPDLQMMFGPFAFSFDERGVIPYTKPSVSLVVNACYPRTRGRLSLRSRDPRDAPLIAHKLLGDEEDIRRQIAGCRFARRILRAPAFRQHLVREYLPGPAVDTDAQWEDSIRRTSFLGYHPVGTCRMGTDADAVVTPTLQVRGCAGLRVIDASVMPTPIAANTNAATMMIAEKGAEMILADRRRSKVAA
jgi:choline dehydrogenase